MVKIVTPLDVQALRDIRDAPIGDFYALRHKPTGLFFNKGEGLSNSKMFLARYPMPKRKGVWTGWLKYFEDTSDWELIEVGFVVYSKRE